MSLLSWLRNRKLSLSSKRIRAQAISRQRGTFRPRLEALEHRSLPSTLTVLNNLDDYRPGSLREVIAAAADGDTIDFDPSLNGKTITVNSDQMILNKNLTIQGPGAGQLTISGTPLGVGVLSSSRVFEVEANVTLNGLTISGGGGTAHYYSDFSPYPSSWDGYGGAILNFGTLTISACTLSGNYTNTTYQGNYGGGIYNAGTLTVSGCTLYNNSAGSPGYRYGYGGGIYNAGTLTVTSSGLYGNSATDGGGIYNGGYRTTATVTGCTLDGNTATNDGGGIFNSRGTSLTVQSSVVRYNHAPLGADLFGSAKISKDSTVGVIGP
jgi:hypothetical protein